MKNDKHKCIKTGMLSYYYIHEDDERCGKYLAKYYDKIMLFYNELFGKREMTKFDYVVLGQPNGGG